MQPVIRIQHEAFDASAEIAALEGGGDAFGSAGAVVTFTGLVRNHSALGRVDAVELEHYPGMTEKSLQAIAEEAQTRWALLGVCMIHRIGCLKAGEPIVFVATASAHREAAFQAASFLMDYLKTRAPFWKKEWVNGAAHWVEVKSSDVAAADRWSSP